MKQNQLLHVICAMVLIVAARPIKDVRIQLAINDGLKQDMHVERPTERVTFNAAIFNKI